MDWWESDSSINSLKITATPSQHFSGRNPFNKDDTLWASWVIAGNKYKIFFSGDSGYNTHFKTIGEKHGPFDLTLLENGQYNKNWIRVHMLPEQALQAHLELKGKILMPIHWGAFNLSIHDWTEPVERLLKAAEKNNVKTLTPMIGDTWKYGDELPAEKWWLKHLKKERK